ncbi:MAG: PAS domain-containing sensor histidine kinase [Bacteroidetes bacterium]|nr:PAS domain-containing sensor histidine kinase [Bacteroidota bacterium]
MFDLEFQQHSLNALFTHTAEGIIFTDSKGKIIRCNPSSEKLFGYTNEQMLQLKVEDLLPKKLRVEHQQHRSNYNSNPHSRPMGKNLDLIAIKSDGTEFPVEISLSYFKKDNELYAIAFVIDITERKKIEEKIKSLNSDLEKKVDERTKILKEALNELEQSKQKLASSLQHEIDLNEMKSRFVSMASHEFRTPLSAILSSASLISKYSTTEDDEKRQKHINRIKSSVTNLTLILNDFLSVGKLEEGKIYANYSVFNLQTMHNECVAEIQILKKENQKIIDSYEGETQQVYLDKQMIKNIYLNLLSNAIKFSDNNKTIILNTKIKNNTIEIYVKDEGIGVPKDEQPKLFERFYRGKNAFNIQGTGLGLNIISKYVELMNGTITFESELNKGTSFNIILPNKPNNEDYFIN